MIYPFLWSNEIQLEKADKKIVSSEELLKINQEYSKKFNCYSIPQLNGSIRNGELEGQNMSFRHVNVLLVEKIKNEGKIDYTEI